MRTLATIVWILAPLAAQSSDSPASRPVVHVVGASLSGGFQLADFGVQFGPKHRSHSAPMIQVAKLLYPLGKLKSSADVMMFQSPGPSADRQLREIGTDTDLVLGLDFLFWFSYGAVDPTRDDAGIETARVALLERGFTRLDRLLERTGATLVIGDLPDMTGASLLMLPAKSIPRPKTLAQLNRRIAEWAKERERVHLFPLADAVEELRSESRAVELEGKRIELEFEDVMQADKLHPTKAGMAILGHDLSDWLRARLGHGTGQPARLPLATALQRLGARAAAKPAPAKKGG